MNTLSINLVTRVLTNLLINNTGFNKIKYLYFNLSFHILNIIDDIEISVINSDLKVLQTFLNLVIPR